MKKIKFILLFLLFLITIAAYWIIEPFDTIPFKASPIALSKSTINFSCAPSIDYAKTFQAKADSLVNNAIVLKDFIGVSTGVYQEDCGMWTANAGFAHKQQQQRSDKNTLYRTASIAKPMTAMAIMQLYEKGQVQLEVPIQTYLPEFPKSEKGTITIRQLLTHTSGVSHYTSTWDGISFTHYDNMVAALEEFKHRPLNFTPGTNYEYTTYGYTVLGAIIEKVTGLSYQDYMKQNIWEPAGMTNTDIENSELTYANKADLYIKADDIFIKSPKTDLSVKYPGGGIHTTAEDLLKFGKAILEHQLVDSITFNQMLTATDTLKKGTPYGFGWFVIEDSNEGRIIQHGGSQSGISSFFKIFLDKKTVGAVLANNFASDNEVFFLAKDLANLAIDSATFSRPILYYQPQKKATLQRVVGTFKQVENGELLRVFRDGQQLYVEIKPYPILPIYPSSKTDFFYRVFDGQLAFRFTDAGEVSSVVYTYYGKAMEYKKVEFE